MSDSLWPYRLYHQVPLTMEFSRQEYWCVLPCPPLGILWHSTGPKKKSRLAMNTCDWLLMHSRYVSHSLIDKKSTCNAGDSGLIPGSGRLVGKGKVYPLQYSGLENSMDCMYSLWGRKKLNTTEQLSLSLSDMSHQ